MTFAPVLRSPLSVAMRSPFAASSGGGAAPPELVSRWVRSNIIDTGALATPIQLETTFTVGSKVVVVAMETVNWRNYTFTDTGGNVYTKIYDQEHSSGGGIRLMMWAADVVSPASLVTLTSDFIVPGGVRPYFYEISNLDDTATLLESSAMAVQTLSQTGTISLTPATPNAFVMGFMYVQPEPIPTAVNGTMYRQDYEGVPPGVPYTSGVSQHMLWRVAGAPGSYTLSSSWVTAAATAKLFGFVLRAA